MQYFYTLDLVMKITTQFISHFLEHKLVHKHFPKYFFFSNIKEKQKLFFLSTTGPAHEKNRPTTIFSLSNRVRKSEAARLGALAHGWLGLVKSRGGRKTTSRRRCSERRGSR
jgi:hypothetical protein